MILIVMLFCHIVDDYYLQGWLANGKQRQWWAKNAPDEKYRHDYVMALCEHAFSWAFIIMLPWLHSTDFKFSITYIVCLVVNFAIHAYVDDLKANKGKINLIQDQLAHICQIVITYIVFNIRT